MNYPAELLSWSGGIDSGGVDVISVDSPPKRTEVRAVLAVVSPRSTATAKDWVDIARKQLSGLARNGFNWDGRGASAIKPEALDFTWSVLRSVMTPRIPSPAIVPLASGGVLIVWNSLATEIEVEVSRANQASILITDKVHDTDKEIEVGTDFSILSKALKAAFPANP